MKRSKTTSFVLVVLSTVACIQSSPNSSINCPGINGSGLTDAQKRKIVDLHNELRQQVASGKEHRGSPGPQPRAKFMPNLEWDDEIASIAQMWTDQCSCRLYDSCMDVDRYGVGQNIAVINAVGDVDSNMSVENMVYMWSSEVENFSRDQVSRFVNEGAEGRMIAHYAQMIWAKTTKIGCGAAKYKKGVFTKFYIICNYSPAGDYYGDPIYEIA